VGMMINYRKKKRKAKEAKAKAEGNSQVDDSPKRRGRPPKEK
jgi:hypothetical protein